MRRLIVGLALILGLLPSAALAQSSPQCQYVLGFAALQGLLPATVGDCRDNEQHNPNNGDAIQHTTTGLLVWRRADNWTAFTDGFRTWINGPQGLVERLNSQRFPWEADADGMPSASNSSASNSSSVSSVTDTDGASPASNGSSAQATYHICGPDAATAQAIQQFIAGRDASTTLVGDGNGCADLTVAVSGNANATSGQSVSTQTVDHISVQITTTNGATTVTLATV